MPGDKQVMITLPPESAEHDQAFERWLVDVAGPIYDRVKAGQERMYTADEVDEMLESEDLAPVSE